MRIIIIGAGEAGAIATARVLLAAGRDVQLTVIPRPEGIAKIDVNGDAWVVHMPRFGEEGQHYHTYGLLTPYFKGLTEGKLMATKCVNPKCPISKGKGQLWVPPRMDCPDCHSRMVWEEIKNPKGYIYTYTNVERGGTGLEIETPYYQVDLPLSAFAAGDYLVEVTAQTGDSKVSELVPMHVTG